MDVNGTRFHLIYGERNWADRIGPENDSAVEVGNSSELILRKKLFRFPKPPGESPPKLDNRRGAARDRYGNWYWIAEDKRQIRTLSGTNRQFQLYWSAKDRIKAPIETGKDFVADAPPPVPEDLELCGLAVTTHHYLVVGTLAPPGLLVFDLHAGGPPIHMLWPETIPFHPFDMAPRPNGGVWILDKSPDDTSRYWALDKDFRVVCLDQHLDELRPQKADDFQPQGGGNRGLPKREFPTGISLALASSLPNINAVALEALPDDTVLIMAKEENCSFLYRYRFGRQLGCTALEDLYKIDPDDVDTGSFALHGYDLAFVRDTDAVGRQLKGRIYIVDSDGNQVFAFKPTFDDDFFALQLITKYYPLRRFTGKALVSGVKEPMSTDQAVFYDLGNRWLPILAHQKPRYATIGMLETDVFDGKEPGCVWHRILLDAVIPAGTMVEVASRAADSTALLEVAAWQSEPMPYRRGDGSEIPYYAPFTKDERQKDGVGTWELLVQNASGRYLQLRLTLQGTGYSTPQVFALRAYYPRFSYLNEYLPAVYQQDDQSAFFLDRFLANMEGMLSTLEGRIAEVQHLFDIRLVSQEYLDWLATWFGITPDPSWDERRQRLFLDHAIELFQQRGTLSGLIRTVRLALDPCVDETLFSDDVTAYLWPTESAPRHYPFTVRIVERYLTRRAPGVAFGDQTVPDIPRLTSEDEPWKPERGSEPLHRRFRQYIEKIFSDDDARDAFLQEEMHVDTIDQAKLSPVLPHNKKVAAVWKDFIRFEIGFTYAEITDADTSNYQSFLQHRYLYISQLNNAYRRNYNSFFTIPLPQEKDMPSGGQRLFDWIQYVSHVVLIRRYAHRFTVLIPINPEIDSDSQIQQRMSLAERIVLQEKPGHTNFEIKPYWALFRVGEARVGFDTLLGHGSRFVALILGQEHLAEAYLGSAHPWDIKDRFITGRDDLGSNLVI